MKSWERKCSSASPWYLSSLIKSRTYMRPTFAWASRVPQSLPLGQRQFHYISDRPDSAILRGNGKRLLARGLGRRLAKLRVHTGRAHRFCQADCLQEADAHPADVQLIPGQAVTRGRGKRVMVVVPSLAERQQSDQ